jgi:hypothetical protein
MGGDESFAGLREKQIECELTGVRLRGHQKAARRFEAFLTVQVRNGRRASGAERDEALAPLPDRLPVNRVVEDRIPLLLVVRMQNAEGDRKRAGGQRKRRIVRRVNVQAPVGHLWLDWGERSEGREIDLEGELGGREAGLAVGDGDCDGLPERDLRHGQADSRDPVVRDHRAEVADHKSELGKAKPVNIEVDLPERIGGLWMAEGTFGSFAQAEGTRTVGPDGNCGADLRLRSRSGKICRREHRDANCHGFRSRKSRDLKIPGFEILHDSK